MTYGAKMPRANPSQICNIFVSLPSLQEQKTIAHFLDRETTRIDTLIAKKRELIGLLEKKRGAIVTEAVTKGCDRDVAMKDSGLGWLEKIPAHWEEIRLKFLSSFITSGSRGWAEYYSDEGSIFLRIGNLSTTSIDLKLDSLQLVQPPLGAEGERTRVNPDDLLISITALIGAVGVVPSSVKEAYVNQHTALVRLRHQIVYSRWAAYCIHSVFGQRQMTEFTSGGTKDGLALNDVGNLLLLIPPIDEQIVITKMVDEQLLRSSSIISKTEEGILELQKYRQALITAAVTGKIDVREEVESDRGVA